MADPIVPPKLTPEQVAEFCAPQDRALLFQPSCVDERESVRTKLRECEREAQRKVEAYMKRNYGPAWQQLGYEVGNDYIQRVNNLKYSLAYRLGLKHLITKYGF